MCLSVFAWTVGIVLAYFYVVYKLNGERWFSVHPLIRVSNQLVAAPMSSDVVVQCYVESAPIAMNQWMRDETGKQEKRDRFPEGADGV